MSRMPAPWCNRAPRRAMLAWPDVRLQTKVALPAENSDERAVWPHSIVRTCDAIDERLSFRPIGITLHPWQCLPQEQANTLSLRS